MEELKLVLDEELKGFLSRKIQLRNEINNLVYANEAELDTVDEEKKDRFSRINDLLKEFKQLKDTISHEGSESFLVDHEKGIVEFMVDTCTFLFENSKKVTFEEAYEIAKLATEKKIDELAGIRYTEIANISQNILDLMNQDTNHGSKQQAIYDIVLTYDAKLKTTNSAKHLKNFMFGNNVNLKTILKDVWENRNPRTDISNSEFDI